MICKLSLLITLFTTLVTLPWSARAAFLGSEQHSEATLPAAEAATEAYTINHGPYLQGLTYESVIVMFTTSHRGFSKVEIREKGSTESRLCDTRRDGLIEANNIRNAIKIGSLKPATTYQYRIISKQVLDFQPYKVTFGEEITTEWYEFKTFDPEAREFSFVAMNDTHDSADKCRRLFERVPLDSAQMVFYVGDILNYIASEEQAYSSFIDVAVEKFATSRPFAVVRGNHETRGKFARGYSDYVCNTAEGKFYGFYCFGDTAVVMLDSGEDKPDTHSVYAGFVAFDEYRLEQVKWLREVVRSKAFRKAKHRIVMLHIPPVVDAMGEVEGNAKVVERMKKWHGNVHWGEILPEVLNGQRINLMLSAHMHSHHILPAQRGKGFDFPIVVNDNNSAVYVRCDEGGVNLRIVKADGEVTLEDTF